MNKPIIILVMGLPGSGKTILCKAALLPLLPRSTRYLNADEVRTQANDWDFTTEGRLRQARRMKELASEPSPPVVVVDMVAALEEQREIIGADYLIFMDTIEKGRFEDTNQAFERPFVDEDIWGPNDEDPLYEDGTRFGCWHYSRAQEVAGVLGLKISGRVSTQQYKETINHPHGLMIGRFQPWHQGHRTLFEKILKQYGRVVIGIRSMPESESNPYSTSDVELMINEDLDRDYEGLYTTLILPNIEGVHWGRDVGYKTGRIHLPADIEAISATQIRSMK